MFKDITPLLADGDALAAVVSALAERARRPVDKVAGIEARGFILAAPVACQLGRGFRAGPQAGQAARARPTRRATTWSTAAPPSRCTRTPSRPVSGCSSWTTCWPPGAPAAATAELVRRAGAEVAGIAVIMELSFLDGRSRLPGRRGIRVTAGVVTTGADRHLPDLPPIEWGLGGREECLWPVTWQRPAVPEPAPLLPSRSQARSAADGEDGAGHAVPVPRRPAEQPGTGCRWPAPPGQLPLSQPPQSQPDEPAAASQPVRQPTAAAVPRLRRAHGPRRAATPPAAAPPGNRRRRGPRAGWPGSARPAAAGSTRCSSR